MQCYVAALLGSNYDNCVMINKDILDLTSSFSHHMLQKEACCWGSLFSYRADYFAQPAACTDFLLQSISRPQR